jgi:uncharacterized protein (DUF952 family)
MPTIIYKILTTDQWNTLQSTGEFAGAPIDIQDGYVHFSTEAQLQTTADKHFQGQTGLFILAVDAEDVEADLKWEPSRGGDLFPHLYSTMKLDQVLWARPVQSSGDQHHLPDLLEC